MGIRLSSRLLIGQTLTVPAYAVSTAYLDSQDVRISVSEECYKDSFLCVPQGAGRTFNFTDAASTDFSGVTEITFDIWNRRPSAGSATNQYSVSLTGGGISVVASNKFRFVLSAADCLTLPVRNNWWEAWVTPTSGEPILVGAGTFKVEDTRKYD